MLWCSKGKGVVVVFRGGGKEGKGLLLCREKEEKGKGCGVVMVKGCCVEGEEKERRGNGVHRREVEFKGRRGVQRRWRGEGLCFQKGGRFVCFEERREEGKGDLPGRVGLFLFQVFFFERERVFKKKNQRGGVLGRGDNGEERW